MKAGWEIIMARPLFSNCDNAAHDVRTVTSCRRGVKWQSAYQCGGSGCSRETIVPSWPYGHKAPRAFSARLAADNEDTISLIASTTPIHDRLSGPSIADLIEFAKPAQRIVAFTGAGISTESGIPDYRGPGGVWERNAPPTLADFRENEETRRQYWAERRMRYPGLRDTQPNAGHYALAKLQHAGRLSAVITQNIDGLHQKAGIPPDQTIELHGTAHRVRCLDCGTVWPADVVQERLEIEPLPACQDCGGILRAATVLFGEALPEAPLRQAFALAGACDLMVVVGSSLVVQPASRVPEFASRSGARLAIINNEPTPLDGLAGVVVRGAAGPTLTALVNGFLGPDQDQGTSWQSGQ
jgi:NAD-dependent deacetylase